MALSGVRSAFKQHQTTILTAGSAILGFLSGLVVQLFWTPSPQAMLLVGLPGRLFIHMFSMIIIPLLFCSIITGINSIKKGESSGQLIFITFALFISLLTFCAVFGATIMHVTGIGSRSSGSTSSTIKGSDSNQNSTLLNGGDSKTISIDNSLVDVLINLVPQNIFDATIAQHSTKLVSTKPGSRMPFKVVLERQLGTNYIGICTFAVMVGFVMVAIGPQVDGLRATFDQFNMVIMKLMEKLSLFIPIGLFMWLFDEGLKMRSPGDELQKFITFHAVGLIGMLFHALVVLPALYFIIIRRNPFTFYSKLVPVALMAFGSSSSSLTLPVTLEAMEHGNKVHRSVTRFVLPLGMTVHMNGSTLYMTMVPIFVAHMRDYPVGFGKTIALCLAVICLVISAPGSPSTGGAIIYWLSACKVIGVPNPEEILALLMVFDWFMSRIRTAINVIGDCFVAAFVEKICIAQSETIRNGAPSAVNEDYSEAEEENHLEYSEGTELKMLPQVNETNSRFKIP